MDKGAEMIWTGVLNEATAVADTKKHRILEATIKLIARDGIAAVTFENVGDLLKTTKANVKYHYEDKELLIFTAARAVVVNAQSHTATKVARAATPEAKLGAIVDGAFEWYQLYPDHVKVWALFVYYSMIHENYARFFLNTRAVGQQRMEMILRALPRADGAEPDYTGLAESIQNLLYGQIIGLGGHQKAVRHNRNAALNMISVLLNSEGVRWSSKR